MSIAADKKYLEDTLKEYRQRLDKIPDELFNVTPPGGGWSYGETYSHILQSDLGSLIAAERCAHGTGKLDSNRLSLLARLIFLVRRFPPVKLKVPQKLEYLTVNISKEEARNLLIKVKTRLDQLTPAIKKASTFNKIKHPRLGMFNAKQWLRFTGIHTKHHLRQLDRIDKKFRSA